MMLRSLAVISSSWRRNMAGVNRISALLDLPVLVRRIHLQNERLFTQGVTIRRFLIELRETVVAYGDDVKAALLEMDAELDTVAADIDALLDGVDDETATAIRERTARLRDLHPQDEVPGVPAGEPEPGAETGGDGTVPPAVEPSPETAGSAETQGL